MSTPPQFSCLKIAFPYPKGKLIPQMASEASAGTKLAFSKALPWAFISPPTLGDLLRVQLSLL